MTIALQRLVTTTKGRFLWHTPMGNPYLRAPANPTVHSHESRYADVAFALSDT
ncbi:hypothetical protein [Sulfobacillus thermosulfidooxidans]|uniref:hypothetical protein n=1 Tax=Sulfobacillus thermosulfidooxidans TaxID=28034 RepID=UPI001A9A5912|nr:hypothetical protein [Sulfobacillus thermosulfidooxidans]